VNDWNTADAFDEMAADIESSNPGVYVSARPSWVGKLGILKERKHMSAGLTILCEETAELKRMMAGNEPRMLVGGRKRFCRIWRESSDTIICDRCLTVRHSLPECKATPECRWCGKGHLSTDHKCPMVGCAAPKGVACMHCRKWCKLCETGNHYSGFRECTVLRGRGASQRKYGRATPIDADNTSAKGLAIGAETGSDKRTSGSDIHPLTNRLGTTRQMAIEHPGQRGSLRHTLRQCHLEVGSLGRKVK